MKKLLVLLPLLLALASYGASGSVGQARTAATEPLLVMGGTSTVSVGPHIVGPYPADGVFVYEQDTRCPGVSDTLPSLSTAICWRAKALEYLIREVAAKRVIPGPAFAACNWAYSEPVSWAACVETQIRNATPELRFARSPVWVEGSISGVPYTGCAAGVAYQPFVRVSLADASRIYPLCAWEASNSILAYTLDKWADADGPITSAATDYARAACPAF